MGKTLKIGQVVSFGVGGADKCALNLVKGLLFLGEDIEITVFYNCYSHPRADETFTNPSRFDDYKKLNVKLIEFTDVNELNNYDIDILNTHRSGNDNWFLPNFEQIDFKFKVVETNFHGYNRTKSDHRIYPSNAMLRNLQPTNIPYVVIPNPILTRITEENLREELGIGDKFVYGRIGRPDGNIYTDINLRAYKQVETENTCLLYVAPNPQAKQLSKDLDLQNVIFLNTTSDEMRVSAIYNTFDVLCHSNSLGETFGNTIAEAMINGKPVVSHVGNGSWPQAQVELLGERQDLYVNSRDINTYANIMCKLKDDKEYYDEVSEYLYTRSMSLYNYKAVANEYLKLYRELL